MTKGIKKNPMTKVTEPKSIIANEMPRNRDAKAAGEAWVARDETEGPARVGKEMGSGGDRRI